MTSINSDFNSDNLLHGVKTLRGKRRGGIRVTDDISDTEFQINTNESLQFLAGYISNLLDRIEILEAEAAARAGVTNSDDQA